ncbi:hypothetical protein MsAg5_13030 [Methanosarcinaceae archaeon Ag5]|uniref:Uncharacterized protein n=1 Tax=Methanolapillus africanus TaxID=3028297 RepID=A0AAE4SEA9_9EURY|nr:hypothetical protein [Methanosarcinaceae archaeon Ag5]
MSSENVVPMILIVVTFALGFAAGSAAIFFMTTESNMQNQTDQLMSGGDMIFVEHKIAFEDITPSGRPSYGSVWYTLIAHNKTGTVYIVSQNGNGPITPILNPDGTPYTIETPYLKIQHEGEVTA